MSLCDDATVPPDPAPRRELAAPAWPGDDGSASAAVGAALARHAAAGGDPTAYVGALAALVDCRLLVPVVAMVGEVDVDAAGLTHDKSSDMAAVMLTAPDGRLGLLAFTSTEAMAGWDPAARPVPVTAATAAQAAVQEGAAALVVDLAGPARLVVEGEDLLALAREWRPVVVAGRAAWIGSAPE